MSSGITGRYARQTIDISRRAISLPKSSCRSAASSTTRFDHDVLAQPGITMPSSCSGTNDLRNRQGNPGEEVTALQVIAG